MLAVFTFAASFISLLAFSGASAFSEIGVNYGRAGDNLPSAYQSIQLLQGMRAGHVKLYDADPETLMLLSWTGIQVSIMVPNDQVTNIAINQTIADQWVSKNVLAYYPDTRVRLILVGYEVLSYNDTRLWDSLVPAMTRIHNALRAVKIQNIKIGTPLALDILKSAFPPSSAQFRPEILNHQVMFSLLNFLNETRSYFFVDVYPYFEWSANPSGVRLDYALLESGNFTYRDPGSGLVYTNLLDQMLDSAIFAMRKAGYHDIRLAIAETGWPNSGDLDQPGTNTYNAATYNRNLARKVNANPPKGTPARPNVVIPTYISSLYDENLKDGPGTERHWGLLRSDGRPVYEIDLSGQRPNNQYRPLPLPSNNQPYKGNLWCVVASGANTTNLARALDFACSQGAGICAALSPLEPCYQPVSVVAHANYAFSSYWAKFRNTGATCYFNGLAVQTTIDPSHGSCKFPSVTL